MLNQGKLESSAKSITEVRQEAMQKLTDPAMLAQVALGDQNPEIRKTAKQRLAQLNN